MAAGVMRASKQQKIKRGIETSMNRQQAQAVMRAAEAAQSSSLMQMQMQGGGVSAVVHEKVRGGLSCC